MLLATSVTTTTVSSYSALETLPPTVDIRPAPLILYPEGTNLFYEEIRKLGEGSFALVLEVLTPKKVHHVAMKIPYFKKGRESSVQREVAILKRVQEAPHTIKYLGDFKLSHLYFKDKEGNLYIQNEDEGVHSHAILTNVLPCPDTCVMFIKNLSRGETTRLSSAQILSIGKQGFETLRYLQSEKLAHLDLKPENMAYDEVRDELFICDFGSTREIGQIEPQRFVGTMPYRAPEQLLRMPYNGSVDVWSLAVTLFELYTGFPLIDVEGSLKEPQTVVDLLHLITHNIGLHFSAEFIRSVHVDYQHFFKANGSFAHCPSENGKKELGYFTQVGRYFPGIAVWKGCIQRAARKKKDNLSDVKKLIALLEPMLCYENRITPDNALKKFEASTELKMPYTTISKGENL